MTKILTPDQIREDQEFEKWYWDLVEQYELDYRIKKEDLESALNSLCDDYGRDRVTWERIQK